MIGRTFFIFFILIQNLFEIDDCFFGFIVFQQEHADAVFNFKVIWEFFLKTNKSVKQILAIICNCDIARIYGNQGIFCAN